MIFHNIFQITIDISPPHEGSVHDGLKGDPEVDYQQQLHLHAHWEGFFDRESGVESYLYTFSNRCVTREEFKNISMVRRLIHLSCIQKRTYESCFHGLTANL